MATLTTQIIVRTGLTPTYAAAAGGGDACEVGDDMFLHYKNTNAAARIVTLAIPSGASTYPGVVYTNTSVTVPATTGDKMIGPLAAGLYKDSTTGMVTITYDAVTNLTVGAFKLQAP
ncbi:MAG TPA: hypothetical protein VFR23_20205 [Jiangellaceae bacterium]|nr:hypothetical protein [Jiangellaceae bacterium]